MSLVVPSTQDVADNIVAQLEGTLSQTVPVLPKAFLRVLAKVLAAVFILIYKYAGFSFLQMFVAHATMEETVVNGKTIRPLVEWGRLIGVGEPIAATPAELLVAVTVTNQEGTLAAGTQLVRTQTNFVYQQIAPEDIDAPSIQITIRASSDDSGSGGLGSVGNLQPGDIVSFANPIANVARDAVVVSQSVTASDAETVEAYRARIIRRFQARPQGGAHADYRDWAEEVAGIVHAYPYSGLIPGEVDVYCEATEESSGSADGIPTGAQLTAVFNNIELEESGQATRRPVNAGVNALAITRTAFEVIITGLTLQTGFDDGPLKADIEQGLDEYLRSREPFIVGLSVLPRDDRITNAALGGIVDGIVNAAAATVATVGLDEDLIGTAYTLGRGEKAKLLAVTYL